MKRVMIVVVAGLSLAALMAASPVFAEKQLKVVCTLTDLAWLAEQVGGDEVQVSALCPGEFDPHFLPAKPSLARRLGKADLLCYSGLELEIGWLPVLLEKARNRKLRPGEPGELDCSHALKNILDVPAGQVSRAQGDVHPQGNPHYLLDPRNGILVVHLIADRMARLRPEAAEKFQQRAERVATELEARIVVWEQQAAGLRGRSVVQYHQQWEYLVDWLGLTILGDVEHRPGIAPSPRHVSELVRQAKGADVELLLAAPWNHLDAAGKAAKRMSVRLVVLPPGVDSLPRTTSYLELFDRIIADLVSGPGGSDG